MPNKPKRKPDAHGNSQTPGKPPPNFLPPPIEGNKDGEGGDDKRDRRTIEKTTYKPEHWTTYAEAACAVALVLITGFYTYYASKQAKASETAAKAAESAANTANNSLVAVQRAFLSVSTFDITRLMNPTTHAFDGTVRIAFNWQNGGDTPTKDMTVQVTSRWFPEPMSEIYPLQEEMAGHSLRRFVGPKTSARSQPFDLARVKRIP
jgi:hypothetical protein